jgi:NACalpha-BTF3-like transcription factor
MAQCTIIYPGHYDTMDELTNEQAGLLIKTIGKYHRGEDITITDPVVKGVWLGIKHDFKAQKEKYEATCERNQKNGLKGGRPKTQKNPKNPSGLLETQPIPNNLKEKEKEKEKDKEKYKKKDNNLVLATKQIEVKNSKTLMSESEFDKIML